MVAAASPSEWFAVDDSPAGDPQAFAPWLYDAAGNPIELPGHVIGFRVRCVAPGARGFGELVIDEERGGPLFVPRETAPEEFAGLVRHRPGRYRLVALDERHRILDGVPPAVFVVTPTMAARANGTDGDASEAPRRRARVGADGADPLVRELLGLVQALVQENRSVVQAFLVENRESSAKTSSALADSLSVVRSISQDSARSVSELVRATATVVTAADGAGISRRDPLPLPLPLPAPPAMIVATQDAAPAAAPEKQPLADVIALAMDQVGPLVAHLMNTRLFGLSNEASAALVQAQAQAKAQAKAKATPAAAPVASVPPVASAPAAVPAAAAPAPPPTTDDDTATEAALNVLLPAIASYLRPDEIALLSHSVQGASRETKLALARHVVALPLPDAVAWVRALVADATAQAHATAAPSGR
jgi:hypothetical protein